MRAEMTIRTVRAEALQGRLGSATRMMWQGIRAGSLAWVCREGGEVICRRVLLEYMREAATAPVAKREPDNDPAAEAQPSAGVVGALAGAVAGAAEIAGALASAAATAAGAPPATPEDGAAAPTVHAGNEAAKVPHDGGAAPTATAAKGTAAPVKASAAMEPAAHDEPSEPTEPEMAIEVYLALPAWDRGPLAPELSEAAADLANHIGAPVFGGNILSSVIAHVTSAKLSDHLVKAAELYLEGDDIARTRLVIEYARTRLGKRMPGRWIALEKKLAARVASEEEAAARPPLKVNVDAEAIARELAAARAASARATRLARAETAPKKQGDQP